MAQRGRADRSRLLRDPTRAHRGTASSPGTCRPSWNEITFRFNRRRSRAPGMLFYRLLGQAFGPRLAHTARWSSTPPQDAGHRRARLPTSACAPPAWTATPSIDRGVRPRGRTVLHDQLAHCTEMEDRVSRKVAMLILLDLGAIGNARTTPSMDDLSRLRMSSRRSRSSTVFLRLVLLLPRAEAFRSLELVLSSHCFDFGGRGPLREEVDQAPMAGSPGFGPLLLCQGRFAISGFRCRA